jgi:hypothetical protein
MPWQGAALVGADVEFISDLRHDGSEVALVQLWLPEGLAAGGKAGKRPRGGKAGRKGGPAQQVCMSLAMGALAT